MSLTPLSYTPVSSLHFSAMAYLLSLSCDSLVSSYSTYGPLQSLLHVVARMIHIFLAMPRGLWGSQFPHQGLNLGHSSDSAES